MKAVKFVALATAMLLVGSLAACQEAKAPEASEQTAETAAPDAKPGMTLSEGQLILPAVTGRPAAVYFQLRNGSDKPVTLVSAHIEGTANTEIHETSGGSMKKRDTIEIKPGETIDFARGGLHVMAFEPSAEELTAGGTTELTLTFEGGDKLSSPIGISAAGDADMAGMEH